MESGIKHKRGQDGNECITSLWNLSRLEDEGKIQMKKQSTRAIKVIGFQFVKMEESA